MSNNNLTHQTTDHEVDRSICQVCVFGDNPEGAGMEPRAIAAIITEAHLETGTGYHWGYTIAKQTAYQGGFWAAVTFANFLTEVGMWWSTTPWVVKEAPGE